MPNQYKNKVVYFNEVLIDISDTTAVADDVVAGKYVYLATGQKAVGTIIDGDEIGYGSSQASSLVGTATVGTAQVG